jgi:hypothetical protein
VDNWQHSLGSYFESNAELCEFEASRHGNISIGALIGNLLAILLVFAFAAGITALLVVKVGDSIGLQLVGFAYKPVPQMDAPISV